MIRGQRITPEIVKKVILPRPRSHKGENGRLLIIAGSEKYHGALLYAIRTASRIVDLVYVLTTPENQAIVKKLKSQTAEFICISDPNILMHPNVPNGVDCVLIGPGMGVSARTKRLVTQVLKSEKRAVLDADALNVLDAKLMHLLNEKHVLTPHHWEFERLLAKVATSPFFPPLARGGRENSREEVKRFIKRYHCTVVLKGPIDLVATPQGKIYKNYTGNAGMTKGGTGDVLAGLIAALFCVNDAFTSAAAGVFINGLAGDALHKKVGPFFNAEDLAAQIPKTLSQLLNHKFKIFSPL